MLHHVAAVVVVVVAAVLVVVTAAAWATTVIDVDAGRLRQSGLSTLGDLTEIFCKEASKGRRGPSQQLTTSGYFFLMHRLYLVYF